MGFKRIKRTVRQLGFAFLHNILYKFQKMSKSLLETSYKVSAYTEIETGCNTIQCVFMWVYYPLSTLCIYWPLDGTFSITYIVLL